MPIDSTLYAEYLGTIEDFGSINHWVRGLRSWGSGARFPSGALAPAVIWDRLERLLLPVCNVLYWSRRKAGMRGWDELGWDCWAGRDWGLWDVCGLYVDAGMLGTFGDWVFECIRARLGFC